MGRYATFSRTFNSSCRAQLLHCIEQVACADLFETNIIVDANLVVESSIEQARNMASISIHCKATCIGYKILRDM